MYFGEYACSLDPERKKESMDKYLGPTQPWDMNWSKYVDFTLNTTYCCILPSSPEFSLQSQ